MVQKSLDVDCVYMLNKLQIELRLKTWIVHEDLITWNICEKKEKEKIKILNFFLDLKMRPTLEIRQMTESNHNQLKQLSN